MNIFFKFLAILLGYKFFGIGGAISAIFIVLLFEGAFRRRSGFSFQFLGTIKSQQAFFNTTFEVMGCIAKSDGRVSEREIQVAEQLMNQMGLSGRSKQKAIAAFTRGKQTDFNLEASLLALHKACQYSHLLHLFLELQIRFAYADGHLNISKKQVLENISRTLGLGAIDFAAHEAAMRGEQFQYQRSAGGSYRAPPYGRATTSLSQAYAVLGVSSQDSDADIKKAYRKLMSENHPDKLMAKGLPQDMLKVATEKTQQIQKAYEQVKAARGM